MTASVMPVVTPYQAMWEVPFVTISYYIVQAARRAGVNGTGAYGKSARLCRKFAELDHEELEAEKRCKGFH